MQNILKLLDKYNIKPLHDRGQNFLLDVAVLDATVEASAAAAGELVLEVGPGSGVLTERLLKVGAEVVAVELDSRLRQILVERFSNEKKFKLLAGDILTFSNADLLASFPFAGPYKVVANIPYNITSPLLKKFLLEEPRPTRLTLLVQKEVADRILAKVGDMSQLAVFVQTLAKPRRVRNVLASSFLPPPKVDSSVIDMEIKTAEELNNFFGQVSRERYFQLVQAGFSSPRKQLKNNLSGILPDASAVLTAAGLDPTIRPERLTIEDWQRIALKAV